MEVNHSIDDRRSARQQEQRMLAESTNLMLTVTRPVITQQKALARFWADAFEAWVDNLERMTESIASAMFQQARQQGQQTSQQHIGSGGDQPRDRGSSEPQRY